MCHQRISNRIVLEEEEMNRYLEEMNSSTFLLSNMIGDGVGLLPASACECVSRNTLHTHGRSTAFWCIKCSATNMTAFKMDLRQHCLSFLAALEHGDEWLSPDTGDLEVIEDETWKSSN
ncbi:uncharacterized protein [Dysidea avara]|uniref:uncharacterized protein n=1 Tax=Dysidea avara TaxID=196820 RepID=UPI00332985F2